MPKPQPRCATLGPALMTARECSLLATAAGGWNQLRERAAAYGEPAAVALRAYDLALEMTQSKPERDPLSHPAAVASYLAVRYGQPHQEIMGAILLDTRNRAMGEPIELYRGTLDRAAVEPRTVLVSALLHGAAGVILFHNHPSGDPSPSAEDIAFTRRMAEAGEVVGVRLVDHLVVAGPGRFKSLRESGAF